MALSVAGRCASAAGTPRRSWSGTDGPGYTITLKKSGKLVKTLKAGSYMFVINDKSNIHGYSLRRPARLREGLRHEDPARGQEDGGREAEGREAQVLLSPNHESTMFAHFTVK